MSSEPRETLAAPTGLAARRIPPPAGESPGRPVGLDAAAEEAGGTTTAGTSPLMPRGVAALPLAASVGRAIARAVLESRTMISPPTVAVRRRLPRPVASKRTSVGNRPAEEGVKSLNETVRVCFRSEGRRVGKEGWA